MLTDKSLMAVVEAIKNAQDIALISHVSPDPDTLGSCFALKRALEKSGKKVTVYADAPYPAYLSFLYDEYTVYSAPAEHTLCMSVDCGDLGRIGERAALLEAAQVSVNIDHHPTNTNFAQLNFVLPKAAATAEIVDLLLCALEVEMDPIIATRLYAALTGDTGSFRYSNTTPATMHLAAKLLDYGVDNWFINKTIFEDMSLEILKLRGALASEMRVLKGGKVCAVVLTQAMCTQYGVDSADVENIVNIPRSVSGCEIAASFKESDGKVKISLRSSSYADVSAIAVSFGGGGHKRAAGFVLEGNMEEVVARVLDAACACIKED